MKWFLLLLWVLPSAAWSLDDEITSAVDGQTFTLKHAIWIHQALPEEYQIAEPFTVVYQDEKWQRWKRDGSPTLQKILDLGPNIVFTFKGGDDRLHVYGVFLTPELATAAIVGGSAAIATGIGGAAIAATNAAGMTLGAAGAAGAAAGAGAAAAGTATTVAIGSTASLMSVATAAVIGGGAIVGAVVVENNNDNSEASPTKR